MLRRVSAEGEVEMLGGVVASMTLSDSGMRVCEEMGRVKKEDVCFATSQSTDRAGMPERSERWTRKKSVSAATGGGSSSVRLQVGGPEDVGGVGEEEVEEEDVVCLGWRGTYG